MSDVSNEFFEMRFRKTVDRVNRNFSMNGDMYRLFFALDDTKTMAQVASQVGMDPPVMMESVARLWHQGLIEPIGLTNLCVDPNFSKLLKINLYYIVGHKAIARSCVETALKELGLSPDQLPATRVSALVAAVSSKISNPKVGKQFRDYMETLLPLRTKMTPFWGSPSMDGMPGVAGVSRGKTRRIIDRIIMARSGGNPMIAKNIKTKLILKGINPDAYLDDTLDNPQMLEELRALAATMGVDLNEEPLSGASGRSPRGQIRRLILEIIESRSKGNPIIARDIRAKLFLKGIDVDRYGPDTPDNPAVLDKIKKLAMTMGRP